MSHWGKFSAPLAFPKTHFAEVFFGKLAQLRASAQRFYVPSANNIIGDRALDDVKDLIKLPYPSIALLYETHLTDGVRRQDVWAMALAFSEEENERVGVVESNGAEFYLCSCVLMDGLWFPVPIIAAVALFGRGPGIHLNIAPVRGTEVGDSKMQQQTTRDFIPDALAISNLCALMALKNVAKEQIPAPPAVNKKRSRNGKLPLYDYHVLVVDGERWDSPHDSKGDGDGVRSHLRRGHIRRLPGKNVWVRATFVHGSVPGFVDKDYDVRIAA